jgi:transposase
MKKRNFESMPIINSQSAGIDVGSRSHFVAIGQDPEKDVSEFGVYSQYHQKMIDFLRNHRITTIAMESTGSYWQSLFYALQNAGFEVLLVSGQQTKNVRAKTDVKDCVWIQKLHSLGLLRGCFLPDKHTAKLRHLYRHRMSLIEESAKMTNKMQKAMRMMNVRLDVVINDITGKTGIAIIEAILAGERDGQVLSQLTDSRIRRSKEEIALALKGRWDEELLYELEDCYQIYMMLQGKIKASEKRLEILLNEFTEDIHVDNQEVNLTRKQTKGKNQPKFNLTTLSYKFYGVDLFAIESISTSTVLTLICEIGKGIYKFHSAKQFASFLRLAPNNRISGGKVISSRTPKGGNKFALALRNAANTIDRTKDGALTRFFKRVAYKKGRAAAITATARKLAVIIWNMIVKNESYQPLDIPHYKELIKARTIASIKNRMIKMDISLLELSPQTEVS